MSFVVALCAGVSSGYTFALVVVIGSGKVTVIKKNPENPFHSALGPGVGTVCALGLVARAPKVAVGSSGVELYPAPSGPSRSG